MKIFIKISRTNTVETNSRLRKFTKYNWNKAFSNANRTKPFLSRFEKTEGKKKQKKKREEGKNLKSEESFEKDRIEKESKSISS